MKALAIQIAHSIAQQFSEEKQVKVMLHIITEVLDATEAKLREPSPCGKHTMAEWVETVDSIQGDRGYCRTCEEVKAAEEAGAEMQEAVIQAAIETGDYSKCDPRTEPIVKVAVAEARLEEAKWWRVGYHGAHIPPKHAKGCDVCNRIAQLESDAKGEQP